MRDRNIELHQSALRKQTKTK